MQTPKAPTLKLTIPEEVKTSENTMSNNEKELLRTLNNALSKKPNKFVGTEPRNVYRKSGWPEDETKFKSRLGGRLRDFHKDEDTMAFSGKLLVKDGYGRGKDYKVSGGQIWKDMVWIAFTMMGDKGRPTLFLHGVPTNRTQYYRVLRRTSPFVRGIAIDMLGMGESDMPRAGPGQKPFTWWWYQDCGYIHNLMRILYPTEEFTFVSDDWGGGIGITYASIYPGTTPIEKDRGMVNPGHVSATILIDPVAFDGYPVSEIQAFGRASQLPDNLFPMLLGAADQTMVQIFKNMVRNRGGKVWNQYSLRLIKESYIKTDYEEGDSLSMSLKIPEMRVLTDRAAFLAGYQLLPWSDKNEKSKLGVRYNRITNPVMILWGKEDNMMPPAQKARFKYACINAPYVDTINIPDSGHFAAADHPETVTTHILNFIEKVDGRRTQTWKTGLADIFLGYDDYIWKGDEKEMVKDMRRIYGK